MPPIKLYLKRAIIQFGSEEIRTQGLSALKLTSSGSSGASTLVNDINTFHSCLFPEHFVDISCSYNGAKNMYPFAYRTHAHGLGKSILDINFAFVICLHCIEKEIYLKALQ